MLCQNCGKNQANTHIKTMINGETREYFLCQDCAAQLGYNNIFSGFNMDFDSFFGSVLTGQPSMPLKGLGKTCPFCGSTFENIINTGKAGCANCYTEYFDSLMPSIQRLHGNAQHIGKLPRSAGAKAKKSRELENLKSALEEAVSNQEYEKAAELRDKIKAIEKEVGGDAR